MVIGRTASEKEIGAKRRLLQKLQAGSKLDMDIREEVNELVLAGHYTQAFLTEWMAAEQIAIHIIRTSVVCNWCEDTFNSIKANLGDVGYKEETFEKKIYDPLFSKYSASRSNFEKINAEQVYKCLSKLISSLDEYKIKQLLADKLNKELIIQRTGKVQTTIRKQRNDIIHKNGRIDAKDYKLNQPYFDYFFEVIQTLAEQ
jgi:hypothetical protein